MECEAKIPEFYAGKSVLVTGGTGFLGKALLWKLLHSCPRIENIYVLLRPKWAKTVDDRKYELLKTPIFDSFRATNPEFLAKIKTISGDVTEKNFGLSDSDLQSIFSNVSIIFYGAAILKMDASLKLTVNINTRGVIRCMDMAMKMEKLQAFVYISTAYCCSEESHIEEKLYNLKYDPQTLIQLLDWLPQTLVDKITNDLIAPLPNTYAFSKRLAELILANFEKKVPIVIARPTIVVPSLNEPIPGWTDNLNGPTGISLSMGKGVLHTIRGNLEMKGDMVPVDVVCNSLITIPWAEHEFNRLKSCIPVYNLAMFDMEQIPWSTYIELGTRVLQKYPFDVMLWYPTYGNFRSNLFVYKVESLFYHWVPAYLIDGLLYLLRQKTFMVRVQTKISNGLKVLTFFTTKEWSFQTDNLARMKKIMTLADSTIFPVAVPAEQADVEILMVNALLYVRKKFTSRER